MIRQVERTTPHRQYIASYEDAITRKSANHNPFIEPMIFSGIGSELLGGSHYIQDVVDKFDKIQYHRGMPLPDLRFHPSTLAVGENQLKEINIIQNNISEKVKKPSFYQNNREILQEERNIQEEEPEDNEDGDALNRLFSGGRRRKQKPKTKKNKK